MDADTRKPNILTLRFPRRLEREYQRYYSERNVGYARLAFASGIIMYALYAYVDYVLSPTYFPVLITLRLGIVTPLMLVFLLFMFTRTFAMLMQPALVLINIVIGLSIDLFNVLAFDEVANFYFFGVMIVNMYLHTFGRIQWAWAAPAGILNVLFCDLSLLYTGQVNSQLFILANYFMISSMLLGMVGCYTIEHAVRREFLHVRRLSGQNAELQEHSRTDPLTGLLNRRSMLERLDEEYARSTRSHRAFSIAILDADHFKQINDRWGHECGDQVLKAIASLMKQTLRTGDIIARWGGEEFLVLFPETRLAAARIAAEQLRRRIAAMSLHYSGMPVSITVTIGLSESALDESIESAIRRADEALYEGKRLGRDRTIAAVAMHASTA